MTKIIGFAGTKQAGKTTASNFLHGYQMRCHSVINNFSILEDGKLMVESVIKSEDGEEYESKGMLDVNRSDMEFAEWAAYNMWPFVKSYSMARPLKEFCIHMFKLNRSEVYGNNAQKDLKTKYRWEDMPGVTDKTGRMTNREFLQFFGSDLCRKIYPDIWQRRLVDDIQAEQPLLAVIDDLRFPNEVEAIQDAGGKVIYLTRNPYEDSHHSENQLANYDGMDAVIDNANLGIHDVNVELVRLLESWGWLGGAVVPSKIQPRTEPNTSGIHTFKKG
jgi:hypothetical protein